MSESIIYVVLDDLNSALDKIVRTVPIFAESLKEAFWDGDPNAELMIECRVGNALVHTCIHRDVKDMTRYVFHNVIQKTKTEGKTKPAPAENKNPENWGPWDDEYYDD